MKILICGGRDFTHMGKLVAAMKQIAPPTLIIQGGAKGADYLAKVYAKEMGIHCAEVKALWDEYGAKAGPMRNEAMLFLNPDLVLAMPGGRGTGHMCLTAAASDITVWRPYG